MRALCLLLLKNPEPCQVAGGSKRSGAHLPGKMHCTVSNLRSPMGERLLACRIPGGMLPITWSLLNSSALQVDQGSSGYE